MEFPETAEALMYISHTGQVIRDQFSEYYEDSDIMLELEGSISILFKQLEISLGLQESKDGPKTKGSNAKSQLRDQLMRSQTSFNNDI